MHSSQSRFIAVAAMLSLSINGCATYIPIDGATTPGPATVRLLLTDAAHSETIGSLGSQIVSLEGAVRSLADSTVTLTVTEIGRVAADNQTVPEQSIVVPTRLIGRVERKKIMVGRSLMLAGAITGAVVWIGLQAGHGSVSYRRPSQPPPPGQ